MVYSLRHNVRQWRRVSALYRVYAGILRIHVNAIGFQCCVLQKNYVTTNRQRIRYRLSILAGHALVDATVGSTVVGDELGRIADEHLR